MTKEILVPLSAPSIFFPDGSLTTKLEAGRVMFWNPIGDSGGSRILQPALHKTSVAMAQAAGANSSGYQLIGTPAPVATGTATGVYQMATPALRNYLNASRRVKYVSSAAAGSVCGARISGNVMTVGNNDGLGGLFFMVEFGCDDAAAISDARQFVGISGNSAVPTNVEPSTLTGSFGVGHGAADTNLKIFYGGAVPQTPIDLGSDFPANTLGVDLYRLTLYSPTDEVRRIYWKVERVGTPYVAEGYVDGVGSYVNMWNNNNFICPFWSYRSNNTTALAAALSICKIYFEMNA